MTEPESGRSSNSAYGQANVGVQARDVYGVVSVVHVHEADLNTGSARTALRRAVLAAQNGAQSW